MGANTSDLTLKDIDDLQQITPFNQKEIKKLYKRFKRLDRDNSGTLSTDELMLIPELAMNPLCKRVVAVFQSAAHEDQLNFKQFLVALSVFSPLANPADKMRFLFKVYDLKGDGRIDREEVRAVLDMMVARHITPDQLDLIVDRTMADADEDDDGFLSPEEFTRAVADSNFASTMTISFEFDNGPLRRRNLDVRDGSL
eukprot:TRINITY_DN4757_c0_g1_i2.p1 TRINITY_DN4757_c0_g1~~TRINITY_DN4757_c0_g1_i2.p1  ORF type:complete len:223 (-),score=69.65 TRINITY_DN4757_c0_g1_i2:236-829(-)